MNLKYCICLLLACLLFCLLCNPLPLYFLSDDFDSMFMAQTWSGVIHSYRPGSDFLLHTDHLLYGYNASGYHITNYLLHILTAFMLFFTTKQLLLPYYIGSEVEKYAFVTSIIFLFYPFHSECIFWLVGRSSLLAAFFAMASIYCYLRKKESLGWYLLSLLNLMLGLFSYESVWTLPAIIIILSFIYDKGITGKNKVVYIVVYWSVFFSYLIVRFYLTTTVIGSPYGTQRVILYNLLVLMRHLASLISRSFVPPMQSTMAFAVCVCVIAIVLVYVLLKISSCITVPMIVIAAAFLLSLLPVISFGINTHDTESERYLYMPSLFLSMLFSIVLYTLFINKAVYAISIFLVVQIIFLVMSYRNFMAASKVAKATVMAIQALQEANSIYCIDLPGQYKGGFIFRNGIANAVNLFTHGRVKKVHIISQKELFLSPKNYALHYYYLNNLSSKLEIDNMDLKSNSNAVAFFWTDSSLNVYRYLK